MPKNTSVSLGDYFDGFVESKIHEGRFKNASEVIRAGLRLLEEEEKKIQALKTSLEEGIASGFEKNFDMDLFLKKMKADKRKNG
jgi:antitoxin ParD1/3/4